MCDGASLPNGLKIESSQSAMVFPVSHCCCDPRTVIGCGGDTNPLLRQRAAASGRARLTPCVAVCFCSARLARRGDRTRDWSARRGWVAAPIFCPAGSNHFAGGSRLPQDTAGARRAAAARHIQATDLSPGNSHTTSGELRSGLSWPRPSTESRALRRRAGITAAAALALPEQNEGVRPVRHYCPHR